MSVFINHYNEWKFFKKLQEKTPSPIQEHVIERTFKPDDKKLDAICLECLTKKEK